MQAPMNTFSTECASFKPSMSLNSNVKEFTPLQNMAANTKMQVMSSSFNPNSADFMAGTQGDDAQSSN
jgi:sialic acid synthase SpsE